MASNETTNPTNGTPTAASLPPEVIALATRMYDAARNGQIDIFQQALPAGLPANMTNEKGDSLVYQSPFLFLQITCSQKQIMLASYHGHAPLVRLLLQHGADPNTLNDRGQSPLAGAVFKGEKEVVEVCFQSLLILWKSRGVDDITGVT